MTLEWAEQPLWLAVYALAAFRLTILWTRDSLPGLEQMRQAVTTRWADRWWAPLVDCVWCAGFWISAGVVVVSSSPLAPVWQWLAVPLAFSAVAGLLAREE